MSREKLTTAALAVLLLCGCGAKDTRSDYVEPKLAADEVATVKASSDLWIEEVDGSRIKEPGVKVFGQPGNTVKVSPGEHTVVIKRTQGNSLVTYGSSNSHQKFTYTFRAGHTYKINQIAFKSSLKLTDTQTGTEAVVGG